MLGPQTPNSLVNLQQPVSGIIYSQAGLPFYGISQLHPSYTYQWNPSYPNLGYNISGQTPWQPQAQMLQTSFQQVSYPGFGQQNPQAFSMQNNSYLDYRKLILYVGAQRPVAQEIPSYPGYAQLDLNRPFSFIATLELPDSN